MSQITLIVAMNYERIIGVDNKLPWHIPEDLAYFKQVTLGKPIIMGRKTFESIGKVLPKRRNIVISRNTKWHHAGVEVFQDIKDAIKATRFDPEVFIIGGGEIFAITLPIASYLHITTVDLPINALGTKFPNINLSEWELVHHHEIISQNKIKCSFSEYSRVIHKL